MAVYVEAQTDPFEERRRNLSSSIRENGRDVPQVRRPLRGIQIKEDTYAVIRVATKDGSFLPVIDAAGDIISNSDGMAYTTSYANFLIQAITDQRTEKSQVVETFGDTYIFFYGESPRVLQVQGMLLNTADFNWRAEFWENYDRYFRGTKLAESGSRLYLMYDDIIVEGYMLGVSTSEQSETNSMVIPFNFSIFVTGYTNVSKIGDPNFPQPPGDLDYTQISSFDVALSHYLENQNLQRASYIDAVRKGNRSGGYLGSARLVSDAIRNGINDGSDVSIQSFIRRASSAWTGLKKLTSALGKKDVPVEVPPMGRTVPIRGRFRDNQDEFIGSSELSARELAAPLSMADRWLAADQAIDRGVVNYLDPSKREFHDLMGRAGRIQQEIKARGRTSNSRAAFYGITSSLQLGSQPIANTLPSPVRSVPYGISAFEGTL